MAPWLDTFLVALALAFVAPRAMASRGYSLAFTEPASVVGHKRGFVDFSDPGMDAFDSELTISMWMRAYSRPRNTRAFAIQWVTGADANLVQPFTLEPGLPSTFFFLETITYEREPPDPRQWHHYGLSIAADGTITVYIDSEVYVSHKLKAPGQLRGDRTLISLGGNVGHSANGQHPELVLTQGLHGEIDDLSIWSRALAAEEIDQLMRKPLNTSALPSEAALAYTFDVEHCDISDALADCGHPDVARNYGSAGRDYDLLLGKLQYGPGEPGDMYKLTTDAPDLPPLYKLAKPVFHVSRAPLADAEFNVAAPTVLQAVPGESVDLSLSFGLYTASAVLSLPAKAKLFITTSANSSEALAAPGDSLALATSMRVQLDADVLETGTAFQLELDSDSNAEHGGLATAVHAVHVVPLAVPKLLQNPVLAEGLEDSDLAIRTGKSASVASGERLNVSVVRPPSRGKLFNIGWKSLHLEGEPLQANDVISDVGGEVMYTPSTNLFGVNVDSFEVVFRSAVSGLESDPLLVKITILALDDLPQSAGSNNNTVVEDSTQGVRIALEASDAEGKAGLVITRLPTKGKLFVDYAFHGEALAPREINSPYELYDIGDNIVQQYVYQVRAVSSYWGTGLNTGYHAVNVIGSPRCVRQGQSECALDDRFTGDNPSPIVLHDLVRGPPSLFNGAAEQATPDTLLFLRVTAVHEPASPELDTTYDVVEEPTYRYDNVNGVRTQTRCRLTSMEYPEGCQALASDAPLLTATDVKRSELTGFPLSVWSPRFRNVASDEIFTSTDLSEVLGSQYATVHNPRLNYEQVNASVPKVRPYTDFIEVEYLEPVFPVSVQVGQSRGAGSVVGVYAWNADVGEWVQMYSGAPQVTQGAETNGRGMYHIFQEQQCREFFRTTTLRLEIDTVGIPDWNYIDYIKLTGAKDVQSAMIMYGVTEVTYVPHEDAFGDDSFSFSSFDCGGDELRQSGENTVAVHVTPVPDAPVASVEPTETVYVYSEDSFFRETQDRTPFILVGADVDAERLTVEWVSLPTLGLVYSANASVPLSVSNVKLLAESSDADKGKPLRVPLMFEPVRCTERGLEQPGSPKAWTFTAIDEMRFRVIDSSGASTEQTVTFTVVCEDYSYDFSIDKAAVALALFNVSCALMCIGWAVVKRKHPIVKAAQLPFLLLIAFGCILSSCSILPLAIHDQAGPRAGPEGGNPTADSACRLAASLFMMGFMLSFSSLFAKMYRVYCVFGILLSSSTGSGSKKKVGGKLNVTMTSGTILRIIGVFCVVELALVAVWSGTDPLRFHRDVTLRDPQGNALQSVGFCYSHNSDFFLGATCLYHLSVLFMGAWLCYKTMGVSSAFSEAKYVTVAIIGNLEVLIIAIPVLLIVSDSPSSSVFVQAGVIALNDLGALACIFLPKIVFEITGHVEGGHGADILQSPKNKKTDSRSASASVAPGGLTTTQVMSTTTD